MKGGEGGRAARDDDSVLMSMEIETPLHSRIRAFPASRLRLNVDNEQRRRGDNRRVDDNKVDDRRVNDRMVDDRRVGDRRVNDRRVDDRRVDDRRLGERRIDDRRGEDLMAVTPPNGTRMPARLRLSVNRRSRDLSSTLPDDDVETPMGEDSILREEFPLTDRRRALFEPLGPALRGPRELDDENMLPPPDFESASYPQGWVVGKKRKLVNVDVVESMRRIAVHEMNRKDREINGLNEQLEEDSRTMEHLQIQLQQERTKRLRMERENSMLQGQVTMLMNMLDEGTEEGEDYQMP